VNDAGLPASRLHPKWILAAVAMGLAAWRIVVLATDPGLRPGAELAQADLAISEGRLEEATAHARAALAADPLDGRAYQRLATLAARRNESEQSEVLAELAVRHAPREPLARAMAAQGAIERSDWAEAIRHYDHLLRVSPELAANVFPVLVAMAGTDDTRPALVACLAEDPSWRLAFLREVARVAPDPQPLFRELRHDSALTPEEAAAYVGRYVTDKRFTEAFALWASLLPAGQLTRLTTPVDGDFEGEISDIPPFSWDIRAVKGVEAAVRTLPDGSSHALRIQFMGRRSAFRGVRQLLLLPAGDYTLTWRSRLDGLEAARGLRWTVTCADGPLQRIIATEPEVGTSPWRAHASAFRVPLGCPAQWLTLELEARIAAETLAAGTAWFDDLRVLPATQG
jgi:hypothetical protein